MRCAIAIMFASVGHARAKDLISNATTDAQSSANGLVQKLANRAISSQRHTGLESSILGKQGYLANPGSTKFLSQRNPGILNIPKGMPSAETIHFMRPRNMVVKYLHNHAARAEGAQETDARVTAYQSLVDQEKDASSTVSKHSIDNSIFIDTDPSLIASRTGGRSADELISIVKEALSYKNGIGLNADSLAPNFKFEGPVVGPLGKDAFVNALGNVDFAGAFPDWKGQFYGFQVDPIDGNRVWYFARGEGTNKGPFPGPLEATGRRVVNPPQACSMTIDDKGLISRYTIGYVVDRMAGNTGGLGGLYGILYAIGRGLPFPEAQPWSPSLPYQAFQKVGQVFGSLINR